MEKVFYHSNGEEWIVRKEKTTPSRKSKTGNSRTFINTHMEGKKNAFAGCLRKR